MTFLGVHRRLLVAMAALGLAATFPQTAQASDQSGTITKVAFAGGRFLFWMSGTRTGTKPACDCCTRWEMPVTDASSQARVSLILTAYAQGRQVGLIGSGTCVTGSNDTEGVNYFEVV